MHLTLVPYIAAAGEIKTKPTQHSVKELRSIGIQPDVLLCRSESRCRTASGARSRCSPTCQERAVISAIDVDNIYKIPMLAARAGLDQIVVDSPATKAAAGRPVRLARGGRAMEHPIDEVDDRHGRQVRRPRRRLQVAVRGAQSTPACDSAPGSSQAGWSPRTSSARRGGAGRRGRDPGAGRLRRARFRGQGRGRRSTRARPASPYFGICYGMQVAVVEFARNVAGLAGANSTENDRATPHPVIGLITEWRTSGGRGRAPHEASTSAAPCASARRNAASSPARGRAKLYGRTSSASATATATSSTTATARSWNRPAW
jgi:CTP synthase